MLFRSLWEAVKKIIQEFLFYEQVRRCNIGRRNKANRYLLPDGMRAERSLEEIRFCDSLERTIIASSLDGLEGDPHPLNFFKNLLGGGLFVMRKIGSMKFQVESALKEIDCIGQSKHEAKKKLGGKNNVVGIYSIKYFRKVVGSCIRFAKFARSEFHAKTIFDLKPEHHAAYIAQLQEKDVTKGYLCNVESHLLKLQTAMLVMADKYHGRPVVFMEKRLISWRDKEKPKDRSYTEEEIGLLEPCMSANVAKAMRMSLNLGFRTVTICNIRKEHIVSHEDGTVEIYIPKGTGITKGGRWLGGQETLMVPPSYVPELMSLLEGKEDKDRIITIKEGTLRDGLVKACKRSGVISAGFHGFRHTYGRRRLEQIMGDRFVEGKVMIDYILKNRDRGRRMDDGIPKRVKNQVEQDSDRLLFEWVQDCVNIVHAELGHGKSRWALVAVYMS